MLSRESDVSHGSERPVDALPRADCDSALARSVQRLVATLAQAREQASEGGRDAALAALVAQARQELDLADECLLALDRRRQRSAFRQAERIRQRLDALESIIAAQAGEA